MSKIKMKVSYPYRDSTRTVIAETELELGKQLFVSFKGTEVTTGLAESKETKNTTPSPANEYRYHSADQTKTSTSSPLKVTNKIPTRNRWPEDKATEYSCAAIVSLMAMKQQSENHNRNSNASRQPEDAETSTEKG